MADTNAPKPAEKKADPKPLDNEQVHVTVDPKDRHSKDHKEYAEKVKEGVKKEVKKALQDAKKDGAQKQLDAAEKAVDDAKKKVDPKKVDKLKVKVEGEVDGDKVSREKTVTPKEG